MARGEQKKENMDIAQDIRNIFFIEVYKNFFFGENIYEIRVIIHFRKKFMGN